MICAQRTGRSLQMCDSSMSKDDGRLWLTRERQRADVTPGHWRAVCWEMRGRSNAEGSAGVRSDDQLTLWFLAGSDFILCRRWEKLRDTS
jgi:hypothetical protein